MSLRQWAVARQLVEGRSPRQVMRELSISRWTLWRWRQNPNFQHAVARLQRDAMRSSADARWPREVEATRSDAGQEHDAQATPSSSTPSPFLQAVLRDNLARMEAEKRRQIERMSNKPQAQPPPPRVAPEQQEVAGRAR